MIRCPHCQAEIPTETLVAGADFRCAACGHEVEFAVLADIDLSSLAGGSPADFTARVGSGQGSSIGGSSFAQSDTFDSALESDGPASEATPEDTLEASSGKGSSGKSPSGSGGGGSLADQVEATFVFGGNQDDFDEPLLIEGDAEDEGRDTDRLSDIASRDPGESLNATIDFGHLARWSREERDEPGRGAAGAGATVPLSGGSAREEHGSSGGLAGPAQTQMVGLPIPIPGARSADQSKGTLPADSDRPERGPSDSGPRGSSGLLRSDAPGDRTESPSTHPEGYLSDPNSATLAYDSQKRSDRSPTPEPIDITGLSTGNTLPRGPLEGGRGTSQLRPGESQLVGSESVRLKTFSIDGGDRGHFGEAESAYSDLTVEKGPFAGGMGEVYAVRQESLKRRVALKRVKSGLEASASDHDKLISEAVITGQLEHPNIVPVHDLGLAANGLPFYAMKFVEGEDWEDRIKDLSEEENLAILIQVAQAIAFAHSRSVIHRDLKPGNVRLGAFGEVLVMDWGLAARLGDGSEIQPAGTPIYMPPETALEYLDYAKGKVVGKKVDSSRRRVPAGTYCDVYLLGALLFKVVTGRAPHRGKSTFECLRAAAKNEIVKVRRTSELLDIAYKAMATDPEHRHATALEFIDAIRAYQAHAQSIKIARRASQELRSAEALRESPVAKATDIYACYSRAQHGYQNALELWSENKKASRRLKRTLRNFAEAAYGNGDFDLALSLLDESSDDDAAMRVSVLKDQRARNWREKSYGYLRAGLAAASVLAIGALIWSEVVQQRAREAYRNVDVAKADLVRVEKESEDLVERTKATAQEEIRQAGIKAGEAIKNGQEKAEFLVDEANHKADERERIANRRVTAAEGKLEVADTKLRKAETAAREQAFLAAVGSVEASLTQYGAYAARERLDAVNAALTDEQRRTDDWRNLERRSNWRLEATELVGKEAARAATLTSASADGAVVVTLDALGGLAVYEAGADRPRATFRIDADAKGLAVDRSGARAAVLAGGLKIVDLASGAVAAAPGAEKPTAVAFNPAADELLVGDTNGDVRRGAVGPAGVKFEKPDDRFNEGPVSAVGYSPDGAQRFSADLSGRVVVWRDTPEGWIDERETLNHPTPVTAAAMAADRDGRLAFGCDDGTVFEVAGWWPAPPADDPSAEVPTVTVGGVKLKVPPAARRLPSAFLDAAPTRLRSVHPNAVTSIVYDRAANQVLSAGADTLLVQPSVRGSDDTRYKVERRYHDKPVRSVAIDAAGKVYSSDELGRVVRWRLDVPPDELAFESPTGEPVATLSLAPADSGGGLVVADSGGFVRRWNDLRRSAPVATLHAGHAEHGDFQAWRVPGPPPRVVTVAPEERTVVLKRRDGRTERRRVAVAVACVWEGDTGAFLSRYDLGERTAVALNAAEGRLYAAATGRVLDPADDRPVAFAQPLDGAPIVPLWPERTRVATLLPLGDGAVAVGMRDGQVFVWRPADGRRELVPSWTRPHWSPVRALGYDPATGRLASGDNEGRVALWSLREDRLLTRRRLRTGGASTVTPIVRLEFDSAGRALAVQTAADTGARAVLLNERLEAVGEWEGILDAAVDPTSGGLVALRRATPDEVTLCALPLGGAAANLRLEIDPAVRRIAAARDGILAWGNGRCEWRPSDGGSYRVATRVVSRPTPVALLDSDPDRGVTALTASGSIDRWNADGELVRQTRLPGGGRVVAATPTPTRDGWLLAIDRETGTLDIERWDANAERRLAAVLTAPSDSAPRLAAGGGRGVVVTAGEVLVAPLDGAGPLEKANLPAQAGAPRAVAIGPGGDELFVACDSGAYVARRGVDGWSVRSWDRDDVTSAAFLPGGDRLLAGVESGRVLLLDLATRDGDTSSPRTVLTFAGHAADVTHLEVAPGAGGSAIVSGDSAGRVVVRPL